MIAIEVVRFFWDTTPRLSGLSEIKTLPEPP
jgi:hypothetical protein